MRDMIAKIGCGSEGLLLLAACGGAPAPPPPYHPVADLKQLMVQVIDTAQKETHKNIRTNMTKKYIKTK